MDHPTGDSQIQPSQNGRNQPHPSRRNGDGKSTVLVVAVVVTVVSLILLATLYFAVLNLNSPQPPCWPTGSIEVEVRSSTTANATFMNFRCNPRPTELIIVIENSSSYGRYTFPTNEDGEALLLDTGNSEVTITYQDIVQNEKIDSGDRLILINLGPGSDYTIRVYWAKNGDLIHSETFLTLNG